MFPSLGVCSKCSDISYMLNTSCTPHSSDLNNETGCDINLPNNFALGGPTGLRTHLFAASTDYSPLIYGNYTEPLAVIQTIASYDTIFVTTNTTIYSWECVLTPCVLVYDDSSVFTSPQNSVSGFNAVPYSETVVSTQDNYTFGSTPPWNGPRIQHKNDSSQATITYQISQPAYLALKNYLGSLFNGYVTTDGNSMSYTSDNKTPPVQANPADAMQALHTDIINCYDVFANTITDPAVCSIQSAAQAMTVTIRNNYFNITNFTTHFIVGVTISTMPIVDVSWPWMIPVCGLWVLGAILSLGTVCKARHRNMSTLPLNPLTLVFLNVEHEGPEPEWWRSQETQRELAERTQVRLRVHDRRVSLAPASGSGDGASRRGS